MIIDLSSLGKEPRNINTNFAVEDIDLSGEDVALISPVAVEAELVRHPPKTSLTGKISAAIARDCTRCLEPVESELAFSFETAFIDKEEFETDSDVEVNVEDLDVAPAEQGQIDLADVAREQILLFLPIQQFCREDCKGLCPKCGSNLNLIDCKCSDDEIDPRWEALKGLK
jgi:uncharacterized protein